MKDEIRNDWFGELLEVLLKSNEKAETDAEQALMGLIADVIRDNVLFEEKKVVSDETD